MSNYGTGMFVNARGITAAFGVVNALAAGLVKVDLPTLEPRALFSPYYAARSVAISGQFVNAIGGQMKSTVNFDSFVSEFYQVLNSRQQSIDNEIAQVLNDDFWDLYTR